MMSFFFKFWQHRVVIAAHDLYATYGTKVQSEKGFPLEFSFPTSSLPGEPTQSREIDRVII
jgi:hypothetical protein